jgi:hypothetical protein
MVCSKINIKKMTQADLTFLKKWFSDYCGSFYSSDAEDQKNIKLKEQHTYRVCENIREIATGLVLGEDRATLADAIALFHDIGRFPQYAKYRTFRDSISVNHGILGAQTLIEEKVLGNLTEEEQEIVVGSVRFHNAFSVPENEGEDRVFFIRLVRDADKLDIWRVFLDYYEAPGESRASAVSLGLPDIPEYSEDALSSLYDRKIVSLSKIKTLNDFKLLQLSWVFDLNFLPSFRLLSERKYIDRITAHLPRVKAIDNLEVFLKEFVRAKTSPT